MVIPASIESLQTPAVSSNLGRFEFDAGLLCLDFLNTTDTHEPVMGEDLVSYAHLVEWGEDGGLLDTKTVHALRRNAERDPVGAEAARGAAIGIREVLYRLIVAQIERRVTHASDLAAFNAQLAAALSHARLEPAREGYDWRFETPGESFDCMLWPVLASAARLLASPDEIARVRRCGGERCDWLFVDTSRNRSRRWCSMSGCGNRAKAKRHYSRKREQPTSVEAGE